MTNLLNRASSRIRWCTIAAVLAATAVPARGDPPAGPTSVRNPPPVQPFPQVQGTWEGPAQESWPDIAFYNTGSISIRVQQAGAEVTVTGRVTLRGRTGSLPAATGTLNRSGFVRISTGRPVETTQDPACGARRSFGGATLAFDVDAGVAEMQ